MLHGDTFNFKMSSVIRYLLLGIVRVCAFSFGIYFSFFSFFIFIFFLVLSVTGWKALSLSMISIATAMLCKEQGITVAGVCVLYELFITQKVRMLM